MTSFSDRTVGTVEGGREPERPTIQSTATSLTPAETPDPLAWIHLPAFADDPIAMHLRARGCGQPGWQQRLLARLYPGRGPTP